MAGKKGFGAKFSYDSGGGTYVDIANITKIQPYGLKAEQIDTTSHDSPSNYREKFRCSSTQARLSSSSTTTTRQRRTHG
jgi:hypothetical protein